STYTWGPLGGANVYRFSSKMFHGSSGLYYYGYRFYDPNLQRWLNRDPIGEWGGLNLYGFVHHSPLDCIDAFGFAAEDDDLDLRLGIAARGSGLFATYGYSLETKAWHERNMQEAREKLTRAAEEVAREAILFAVPCGLGKVARPLGRFFYDPRRWDSISRAYWRGQANGRHLHHVFLPHRLGADRGGVIPSAIVNAGWNLLVLPGHWNRWMNGVGFWPNLVEWTIRAAIPTGIGGAIYVGAEVGEATQKVTH
ncbi:MAG: RHS repeat-associated core domain-containing protein, partial [Verrucomicrobia bacterium]|nr:RHS repeat-associated core domain-containing protein [Verrucomicrobiota bacterium]